MSSVRTAIAVATIALLGSMPGRAAGRILIYTRNGKGYVHDNIASCVAALKELAAGQGIGTEVADDPSVFTTDHLKSFRALVFANSNNEAFDTQEQRDAFQSFIRRGGGFVGIHSASGSERNWPYFWSLLGGKFSRHAKLQEFTVETADPEHPACAGMKKTWRWKDEVYYIDHQNPSMHVLLAADLAKIDDPSKDKVTCRIADGRIPLAWTLEFDGGRTFYTALGHRKESYADPALRQHLIGGILWAMGGPAADGKSRKEAK